MRSRIAGAAFAAALFVVTTARAQDHDLAEGEKLYVSQCQICHGRVAQPTALGPPAPARPAAVRLAMHQTSDSTVRDVPVRLIGSPVAVRPDALAMAADGLFAFAPPFGPNLRGVVGRPAGSVTGFEYSATMLKTLKGMEWTEAALDVWITSPQAWVPGVYMFYRQPDPEIRRKIILYLKANP